MNMVERSPGEFLVDLGNGIMASMGPVLYSDVIYKGLELANSERPYIVAPPQHHLWDAGISIAGSATDRGILLVYAPFGRI